MQEATLRRLTLVFVLAAAIAGFLAASYSSVWAQPPQQDQAGSGNTVIIAPDTDTDHTFDDNLVTVMIEEGTVASGQRSLAYTATTIREAMAAASAPPAGAIFGATAFRIDLLGADGMQAVGERLAQPVTLVVNYSAADLAAAKNNPLNLKIMAFRDGQGWGSLDTIVNFADGTVSARVSRFSLFAVLAVNPPVAPPPATEPPPAVPPTVILPLVGDATLGGGWIMALATAGATFIATGAYFLRPRRKQQV